MNIYRGMDGVKMDEMEPHFDSTADPNRMEQGISRVSGDTPGVARSFLRGGHASP